jgi:hypothetical protein
VWPCPYIAGAPRGIMVSLLGLQQIIGSKYVCYYCKVVYVNN